MSGGSDLNPFKAAEKLVGGAVDTVKSGLKEIGKVAENVLKDPLPIIETVALTWALGPEGLALGLENATTAAVANAAVAAANGAKMENIAIAAATSYVGAQAGQAAGEAYSPIDAKTLENLGPQYADEALIKQIVTSSSASAAVTALNGGDFKQVLTSGLSGAVSGYMSETLKAQGYSRVDTKILSNATNAATRAILNGTDVGTAIGQSVAATALSATISGKVDQINKNNELGKSLANQFDAIKTSAEDYFTKTLSPLQDKAQEAYVPLEAAKTVYDTAYSKYDSAYQSYLKNKDAYENYDARMADRGFEHIVDNELGIDAWVDTTQQGREPPTKDSFLTAANADAKATDALAPDVKDAATKYKAASDVYTPFKDSVIEAQNTYKTEYADKVDAINKQITDISNSQTELAKGLGEDVTKYEAQLKTDTAELAKQIAEEAATKAKEVQIQDTLSKYGINEKTDKNTQDIVDTLKKDVTAKTAEESISNYAESKRSTDPEYYDAVKRAYDFAISQGKSPSEASAFATAYGNSDYGARLLHTSDTSQTESPAFKVDISGISLTADGDPEKVKNFTAPAGTKLASNSEVEDPTKKAFYDPSVDAWLITEKPQLEGVNPDEPVTLDTLKPYFDSSGEYNLPNGDNTFHRYDTEGKYIGLYDQNGDLIKYDPNLDPFPSLSGEDAPVPPADGETPPADENPPPSEQPDSKVGSLYGLDFNTVPTTASARKASYKGRLVSPLASGAAQSSISPLDNSVSSSGTTDTGQAYNWKSPRLTAQGLSTGVPMDTTYSAIYDPTKTTSPLAETSDSLTQSGIDPSLAAVLGLKAAENPTATYYNYGAQTPQLSSFSATPFQSSLSTIPSAVDFSNPTSGSIKQYAEGGDVMASPLMAASGGNVPHKGSHYVQGAGGGQDDLIDARLADGEYVFDADIVAALGDGSNKEGAKKLDAMREAIRKHKRSAPLDKIPPKAKSPLAYLKGLK